MKGLCLEFGRINDFELMNSLVKWSVVVSGTNLRLFGCGHNGVITHLWIVSFRAGVLRYLLLVLLLVGNHCLVVSG